MVERFVRDEEAVGSSPVTSTNTHNHFLIVSIFIATLKNPKLKNRCLIFNKATISYKTSKLKQLTFGGVQRV